MKEQSQPFTIGVLGDFSGWQIDLLPRLRHRRFVTVTRESFAQFLRNRRPGLTLESPPPAQGLPPSTVGVTFQSLDEFAPENLAGVIRGQCETCEAGDESRLAERCRASDEYRLLYAAWAGLWFLVDALAGRPQVRVRVLDVTKEELGRDFERAFEFDQAALFKRVYEEGVGTFGGDAFNCLIGDYYFNGRTEDISLLTKISYVTEVARVPFLCGLAPGFLDLGDWSELNPSFSPQWFRASSVNADWEALCQSVDGATIFPLTPRFVLAGRGHDRTRPQDVWLNPAFLVGAKAGAAAFAYGGAESSRHSFPMWDYAASGADAAPERGTAATPEVEFEWDCPAEVRAKFGQIGLNALTKGVASDERLLKRLTGASLRERWPLADYMVWGDLFQRLRSYARAHATARSFDEYVAALKAWLEHNLTRDPRGGYNVPFGRVVLELLPDGAVLKLVREGPSTDYCGESGGLYVRRVETRFVGRQLSEAMPSLRIVVLADWVVGGMQKVHRSLKNRRVVEVNDYNIDQVMAGFFQRGGVFPVVGEASGGGPAGAELDLRALNDFTPERLAMQLPESKELLKERESLVALALYVDMREGLGERLAAAAGRPWFWKGLAWRVEGWVDALTNDDVPIEAELVETTLGGLFKRAWLPNRLTHDSLVGRFMVYASRVERSPALASYDGLEGIRKVIEEIDLEVSERLRPVLNDAGFRELEGRWRALRWLADQLAPAAGVTLRALQIDWTSDIHEGRSTLVRKSRVGSPDRRGFLATIARDVEGIREGEGVLNVYVVDHPVGARGWFSRTLRQALPLLSKRGSILVCALDAAALPDLLSGRGELFRVASSRAAERLLLVAEDFVVRKGYAVRPGHPAAFECGPGGDSPLDADLRASGVYLVAGRLASVKEACLESGRVPFEAVAAAVEGLGLRCVQIGRATLITADPAEGANRN